MSDDAGLRKIFEQLITLKLTTDGMGKDQELVFVLIDQFLESMIQTIDLNHSDDHKLVNQHT